MPDLDFICQYGAALTSTLGNEISALIRKFRLLSGSPTEFGEDVAASIRRNLGLNLKRLLKKRGVTQTKLAELLKTEEETVSRWVNGKSFPETRQIDKMRELFGWRYEDLVRDPGTEDPVESFLRLLDDVGLTIVKKASKDTPQ